MTKFVLAVGAMAATLGAATAARADDCPRYAMVTVDNTTGGVIKYQFKWGDGEWKTTTVKPGHYVNHWVPLDDDGCAPTPRVRFDRILGDAEVTFREYKLDFHASETRGYHQGKVYLFEVSRCGCYLDLKSKR